MGSFKESLILYMSNNSNYSRVKNKLFEFVEFGADIIYAGKDGTEKSGGYIIGNYEGNTGDKYFIIRNRTNVDAKFIVYHKDIMDLYRKRTLMDIATTRMKKIFEETKKR
jgi:hypothetical protein